MDEETTGSREDQCELAVNTCTYTVHTQCPRKNKPDVFML